MLLACANPALQEGGAEMSAGAMFVYSEAYQGYRFGDDHPFNPRRLIWAVDLIRALDLLHEGEMLAPREATREDLLRAHTASYVDMVERLSRGAVPDADAGHFGLGTEDNPIFPGMHEAASLAVGGTLAGAREILRGAASHAFNIGGGLHHAHSAQASGFCVYNDLVCAIHEMRDAGLRVAYVDIDAHHGDGVQEAFYGAKDVLTISFHEHGRYLFPGTGMVHELGCGAGLGTAINVPLQPYTDDASWLELFQGVVPPALGAFKPDILVTQHGCDGHFLDPLADLHATTRLYWRTSATLNSLAHEHCADRWLAVGGGGYDLVRVVPRAWAIVWAEMRGTPLPEETPVPESFRASHQVDGSPPLPKYVVDPLDAVAPLARQREISERNRDTLEKLRRMSPLL